jgi:hypothetical protein
MVCRFLHLYDLFSSELGASELANQSPEADDWRHAPRRLAKIKVLGQSPTLVFLQVL